MESVGLEPNALLAPAIFVERPQASTDASFAASLGALLDGAGDAIARADGLASAVALGHGSIAEAGVARAKADVLLEIVAVAAARISGAVNTLLQTQV